MEFKVFDLGLVHFKQAWDFQKEIFLKVKNNEFSAALIFCRHYPVITLGRNANREHILANDNELTLKEIDLFETERGGDVTYHGPGQLILYPILNLNYFQKDINAYLRNLEALVIEMLRKFNIEAKRFSGLTGVWVQNQKIASVGIAIKQWIAFHGLAINVKKEDLDNFSLIRPCGMDIMMTSMESVLNSEIAIEEVKEILTRSWQNDQGSLTRVGRRN